jgi:DNA-directed RNA polymerase subunit RPC12/RpoP
VPQHVRPRRIPVAGARAQLASTLADVVNVSLTGALIRTSSQQRLGAEWPLILELSDRPIRLTARIVRCELAEMPRRDRRRQYALGVAFVNLSSEAQAVLEQVCSRTRQAMAPLRRLYVSLVRRCPKCRSRSVLKDTKRSYRCTECRHEFTGIRIGVLRFAR